MAPVPEAARILLIDDHALFREAIARLLAAQPDIDVIGEGATVDDGLGIVKTTPVDIVLLGLHVVRPRTRGLSRMSNSPGASGATV